MLLSVLCIYYSNILFASLIIAIPVTKGIFRYGLTPAIWNIKIPNNLFGFFLVYCIITKILCPVLADIPTYLPDNFKKRLIAKSFEQELEDIFKNYEVNKFDSKDLGQRPCDIENRFTYILVNINLIEETNNNIQKRYENLIKRKKSYENNIDKINKRAQIAKEEFMLDISPNIEKTNIELDGPHKRIKLWAKEIEKNIKNNNCNMICTFNHIDVSSIKIVEEISSVQKEQDKINKELTMYEKTFDELELKQRSKENQLLVKGF